MRVNGVTVAPRLASSGHKSKNFQPYAVEEIIMNIRIRFCLLLVAGSLLSAIMLVIKPSQAQVSPRTTAVFRDQIYLDSSGNILPGSDRIRSDGNGPYANGTDCVYASTTKTAQGGSFLLRTVSRGCKTSNTRTITLDFTDVSPAGLPECANAPSAMGVCTDFDNNGRPLNICGPDAANVIPDASFNVPSLFRTAPGAPLGVEVAFNLQVDFSKQRAYSLRYQDATVADASQPNVRVMQGTRADLVKIVPKSAQYPNGFQCLGEYNMPFELTVTK
jgi:hypothetical protein